MFSKIEKKLIRELQCDLPESQRPFEVVADTVGISEEEVVMAVREWKQSGVIRRFGALLAHRKAGVSANGMVVWDAPDERLDEIGALFSECKRVSHCYARPRFPGWPYRLYTMIHGATREEVGIEAEALAKKAGLDKYAILFSTREFKKSDTRLFCEEGLTGEDE